MVSERLVCATKKRVEEDKGSHRDSKIIMYGLNERDKQKREREREEVEVKDELFNRVKRSREHE